MEESGAKEIVDNEENKKIILEKICEEPKPTTAYDIQERTKKVIKGMSDDKLFIPLKEYVFSHGMELEILENVVAIYFRDIALRYCGFKVEDLDKN